MSTLKNLLSQQLTNLEQLKLQLESELQLISTRNAEALTKLLEEKAANLDSIAKLDGQVEVAYAADEDARQDDEIQAMFEQAKELVEQCKFRTEINEKAVEQGQLRLEHLRNLLLEARAKESMTYDKSGKPKGPKSSGSVKA